MAAQLKPWHFAGAGILVDEDDREFVLSAVYDDEPAGRLISAAPDLYAAMQALLPLVAPQENADVNEYGRALRAARAALAKVEGRDGP